MNYLSFLVGWFAGWQLDRVSPISLKMRDELSPNRSKQAVSMGAECGSNLGSVIVWDSGELEMEILDWKTENRIYVKSTVLESVRQFGELLVDFMQAMSRGDTIRAGGS